MSNWISISERLPEINKEVLFCCLIDDYFTDVSVGWYEGQKTNGEAIVMESVSACEGVDRDWSPCTHWMPLPEPPKVPK